MKKRGEKQQNRKQIIKQVARIAYKNAGRGTCGNKPYIFKKDSFTEDCFPLHLITNFLLSKQENMVENADQNKVLIIREFCEDIDGNLL